MLILNIKLLTIYENIELSIVVSPDICDCRHFFIDDVD